MRVAVIGASHWHVPLYEPGFALSGARLAAVWDADREAATSLAGRHDAHVFDTPESLLDADIELAFVFGTHAAMPNLARKVIDRGLPMSLEKPCGRSAAEVAAIREAAKAEGVYVAVPLVQRFSDLGRHLIELARSDPPIDLSFRFMAGPPERYERVGCGWLLDPDQSGGGAVLNLAVHFVDLAILLTGSPVASVFGQMSNLLYQRAVEDRGVLSLVHENGAITTIQVGYGFPDTPPRREFRVSLIGREYYVETEPTGLVLRPRTGEPRRLAVSFDTDAYYATYVASVVNDVSSGRAPAAGLAEMEAALAVIDSTYATSRERLQAQSVGRSRG